MPYRFKLDERLASGFLRIGAGEIERAERELKGFGDEATAIHGARKCLKRIRALLRLVRPSLAPTTFRRENARFREIAALLSGTRDTEILDQTIVKLHARYGQELDTAAARLREALADAAEPHQDDAHAHVKSALIRLDVAREEFGRVKVEGRGFGVVGKGLLQCYRHGRHTFREAFADGATDETFHEWRKSVQQHWRHMALLSEGWPDFFNARVRVARDLSQLIGDDHDLAVLRERIEQLDGDLLSRTHARAFVRLARRRQSELRGEARVVGERLFADRPRDLVARTELYWETAPALARNQPGTKKPRTTRESDPSTDLGAKRQLRPLPM